MKLESKYNLGDTVYAAGYRSECVQHQCPDCLGTRQWEAHLPSGEVLTVDCPTCHYGYEVRGTVGRWEVNPDVRQLTIGQVRYDPAGFSRENGSGFTYMCEETGIGSGSVWNEERLFRDYDSALAASIPEADQVREQNNARESERIAKERKKLRKVYCTQCKGTGWRKAENQ